MKLSEHNWYKINKEFMRAKKSPAKESDITTAVIIGLLTITITATIIWSL